MMYSHYIHDDGKYLQFEKLLEIFRNPQHIFAGLVLET